MFSTVTVATVSMSGIRCNLPGIPLLCCHLQHYVLDNSVMVWKASHRVLLSSRDLLCRHRCAVAAGVRLQPWSSNTSKKGQTCPSLGSHCSIHTNNKYFHTLCTGIPQENHIIKCEGSGSNHLSCIYAHTPAPSDEPHGAVCFVPNQSVCHMYGLLKTGTK